ncbi:hypothetical protein IMSAGC022_01338 [Alistipes sp.]|nr:hypothetical protein IMSAGC022_01338 [Alistipes sp.]
MKKVLLSMILCVSILSCAQNIDDNYLNIKGEQYYRVPQDYYIG